MIFLDLEDLLHVAERAMDGEPVIARDVGLLQSALARPQATAFGEDAYPTLYEKSAALLHSLAASRGLLDGNKRLALAAGIAFLGINGRRLRLTNDEAYDLIMTIAEGRMTDEIRQISDMLVAGSEPRR